MKNLFQAIDREHARTLAIYIALVILGTLCMTLALIDNWYVQIVAPMYGVMFILLAVGKMGLQIVSDFRKCLN